MISFACFFIFPTTFIHRFLMLHGQCAGGKRVSDETKSFTWHVGGVEIERVLLMACHPANTQPNDGIVFLSL